MKFIRMVVLSIFLVAASMPAWLEWGFWISPLSYGEIGLTVNEFLSPRWEKVKFNHFHCCAITKTKRKKMQEWCNFFGWANRTVTRLKFMIFIWFTWICLISWKFLLGRTFGNWSFPCLASFYCNNENLEVLPFSWESFPVNIFSLKTPFGCLKEQGKGKENTNKCLKGYLFFSILKTFPFIFLILFEWGFSYSNWKLAKK